MLIKIIRSLSFTNYASECTVIHQCIVYFNYTQPHIDFIKSDSNETVYSVYELVKVNGAARLKNHINIKL